MPQEYRYGTGMRILGIVCCIILLVAFGYGPIHLWLYEPDKEVILYFFLGGAAFFVPLSILGILDVIKTSVIVSDSSIAHKTALKTKTIRVKDIEKYERNENYLIIYSRKKDQKTIKISSFFSGIDEISLWLGSTTNARDKEKIDKEEQFKELSKRYDYGSVKGEKGKQKLKQAKTVTKVINILSIALSVNIYFLWIPYEITMILSIVVGLLIFLTVLSFNGMIKYFEYNDKVKNTSIYSSAGFGIMILSFAIFLRMMFRITVLNTDHLWTPLIIGSVLIIAICMIGSKLYSIRKGKDFGTFTSIVIFASAFTYGTIVFFNEYLDSSSSITYSLTVEGKRIHDGRKTDSYYLQTSDIPEEELPNQYSVSRELYNEKQIGDIFYVAIRDGEFGISYYKVKGKE